VASALDLHIHSTGLSLVCLAAMAAAGLASLAAMVYFRGRHVRILGALDKQTRTVRRPGGCLRLPLRAADEQSRRSIVPRANRGDLGN